MGSEVEDLPSCQHIQEVVISFVLRLVLTMPSTTRYIQEVSKRTEREEVLSHSFCTSFSILRHSTIIILLLLTLVDVKVNFESHLILCTNYYYSLKLLDLIASSVEVIPVLYMIKVVSSKSKD